MSVLETKKRKLLYRDIMLKAALFIGTVFLIVYFLPRAEEFSYHFELNKPWRYGQLMATFDFPIYKDDAVVKRERDSLVADFQPYFDRMPSTSQDAIEKFQSNYNHLLRTILPSADYARHIEELLRYIYRVGVVSVEDMERLRKDNTRAIKVVDNNEASVHSMAYVMTTKAAYEYMLSNDTLHYDRSYLQRCDLNEYILPNLVYDEHRSSAALNDVLNRYSWAKGMVQTGQRIIDRGEIVNADTYSILESLRRESVRRGDTIVQRRLVLVGQIVMVSLMVLLFMIFLQLYHKEYFRRWRTTLLLFMLIIVYCIGTSFLVSNDVVSEFVIPFAMLPIIIHIFLDSRTAMFAYLTTIIICSINMRYPYEFLLVQLPAGWVGIMSLRELSQRSQLFRTAFWVLLTYAGTYFAYQMLMESNISKLDYSVYLYFVINGVLLLFTYPLLFMFEKLFNFTSNVTLVELSNVNNPLLRELSENAPGTFQHSMQVGNLAAEAVIRIGGNSQLARIGALYHDIGKMLNPAFFTENQVGGINPHKGLPYEHSAQIIIDHVWNGLKLADKYNLPQAVQDFIRTHHGCGKTKYFYIAWQNDHPNQKPDDALFTYPGPNPFTKETAVLMMADAVEAASRSLPEYTEQSISQLVDRIIDSQMNDGLFRNSPITFSDINTVKEVFSDKLKTTYHTRISYPELNPESEK